MTQDKKVCIDIHKKPSHRQYRTKILVAILEPGWSPACPWLNLSKIFCGLNFKKKKIMIKTFLLGLYLLDIVNISKTCHVSKCLTLSVFVLIIFEKR